MVITLPFTTPVTNVLRFIIIEYLILKLFSHFTETLTRILVLHNIQSSKSFKESWPSFFLVPYRLHHPRLSALIPLFLVLFINAFLLSIEFGFSSGSTQPVSVLPTTEEISTPTLGETRNVPGGARWISRVNRIQQKCVRRNKEGPEIYAAEGFVRDVFLDQPAVPYDQEGLDVICFDDSRIISETPVNRVSMNISHSGMVDTTDPFTKAEADITITRVSDNLFDLPAGDIDVRASGTLFLVSIDGGDRSAYQVDGSCTGFREFDPRVYCYLSDGGTNRFIIPAVIRDGSDVVEFADVVMGSKLRLMNSGPVFRAEVFVFDDSFRARDGDHLAAIKSLVTTFAPRQNAGLDSSIAQLYHPLVIRSFYIATVLGATTIRNATVNIKTQSPEATERAQVAVWALVMMCAIVGVLAALSVWFWLVSRRHERWNIPIQYNALAEMAMQERFATRDLPVKQKQPLTCAVVDDGYTRRYRPVDPTAMHDGESFDGEGFDGSTA